MKCAIWDWACAYLSQPRFHSH